MNNYVNIKIQGESNAEVIGLPRRRNAKSVMCIETGEIFSSIGDTAIHFGINPTTISNILNPNKSIDNIRGYHLCFLSETMEHIDDITNARMAQNHKISDLTNGIINNMLLEQGIISNIITYIVRVVKSNSQLSIDKLKPLGIQVEKCNNNKKIHCVTINKNQSFESTIRLLNLNMFDIIDQIGIGLHNKLNTMSLYLERNDAYIIIVTSDFYGKHDNHRYYQWGCDSKGYERWGKTQPLVELENVHTVVVPGMLQGHDWDFGTAKNLRQLIIKEGVTYFASMSHCDKLSNIQVPQSMQYMCCWGVLSHCNSLQTINLTNNVEIIPNRSFDGCTSLTCINLPAKLHKIENDVFRNCKNLKNIHIPQTTTHIGARAFMDCENLREIILPNHLQTIHEYTFYGCIRLNTVIIPKSVKKIKKDAFRYCTALKTVTIHRNCVVEENAFSSTTKIKYYN